MNQCSNYHDYYIHASTNRILSASYVYISTITLSIGTTQYSSALFRFQIPTNTYFLHQLTLNLNLFGTFVGPTETFNVLMITDPDGISTLSTGSLSSSLIPDVDYVYPTGAAEYVTVGTLTVSAYGDVSFDLDLAKITRIMTASLSYSNIWNGSLLFWVVSERTDLDVITSASSGSLVAYDVIEYANRDTGSRGDRNQNSRWDRCPVTGLKVPHGEMVMDGFRNVLVSPEAYDPPEPDPMEWDNIADDNEGL